MAKRRLMHSKSNNKGIMINNEADEVIKELFDAMKNIYQNTMESMKGGEFVFNYVQNGCRLYIDSPDCIKKSNNTFYQ